MVSLNSRGCQFQLKLAKIASVDRDRCRVGKRIVDYPFRSSERQSSEEPTPT
jgi:hypothetical protein